MREIKFRAWDKTEEKFIQVRNIAYKPNGQILCLNAGGHPGQRVFPESIDLMQFTGLKDKNGKEIYEGDILKHDLWGLTEVIWEHGMFRGTETKSGKDIILADHQLERTRVIGNIYENPEFLK